MKETIIIVAVSTNNGIGSNNTIPWNIPEELNNFRILTTSSVMGKQNAIIMGRNTWNSLPRKPLKNRINIIVSRTMEDNDQYVVKTNVIDALNYAYSCENIDKVFIIGGGDIYADVLQNYIQLIDKVYLSVIYDKAYDCDKFIDMDKIYETFEFDKENIHLTERYMFMIGNNKYLAVDESCD